METLAIELFLACLALPGGLYRVQFHYLIARAYEKMHGDGIETGDSLPRHPP